mgnify:CR=1 FL=1
MDCASRTGRPVHRLTTGPLRRTGPWPAHRVSTPDMPPWPENEDEPYTRTTGAARRPWIVGDMAKMLSEPPPEIAWLVEGLIPAGLPGIIAAEGGIGKSMTALLIGLGLTSGKGVLGRSVSRGAACGVVYVSMEDDKDEWHRRLHRGMELMREDPTWTQANENRVRERLMPLFPNRAGGADFRLESEWKSIAEVAKSIPGGCGLIILDTFSRLSAGDENSVKETRLLQTQ